MNVDKAHYVGDDENGVYFDAKRKDSGWYLDVMVDSENFTADIVNGDGPYPTKIVALEEGRALGLQWCFDNDVEDESGALAPRDVVRCRYADCREAHPVAGPEQAITCPVCREWMGLD